jgi:hypothetical protein
LLAPAQLLRARLVLPVLQVQVLVLQGWAPLGLLALHWGAWDSRVAWQEAPLRMAQVQTAQIGPRGWRGTGLPKRNTQTR